MDEVRSNFRERCREVEHYLKTLRFIEERGAQLVSSDGECMSIDTTTQHVLKASVFLHLYNLVESTITACLRRIAEEIAASRLRYHHLTDEWRRVWLERLAKKMAIQNPENRLKELLGLCELLMEDTSITFQPRIPANLDDTRIEKIAARYGIDLNLRTDIASHVKRHVVDNHGTLRLIRVRRNELAHGQSSFADCGRDVSVRDLRVWRIVVVRYLTGIIGCFQRYLAGRCFKRPDDALANGAA